MDKRLKKHDLGFYEVIDRPNAAALKEHYETKYYQAQSANYRSNYPAEEREAIRLRIALRAQRADELRGDIRVGRMLDVGCGEGFVIDAYAARGWQVRGMDHSVAGVQSMNPHVAEHVESGDLFALLEAQIAVGERYELVWLVNVLEHVTAPLDLLTRLCRLVATGGLLIVTVPNDGSIYQEELLRTGAIPDRFWIAPPEHLTYFTKDSLERAATSTGWEVRDLQGDFPIDFFLSHPGSNYVNDSSRGPAAHAARIALENLIGAAGLAEANAFYSALAGVGLGRNITAYLSPAGR